MKLISFDIGIKNMAYCILEVHTETSSFTILDWNVINLLETGTQPGGANANTYKCNHLLKKKKGVSETCGKTAVLKSFDHAHFFCPRHSKMQTDYLLPTPSISASAIKKHKIDGLRDFAIKYGVIPSTPNTVITKSQLLEKTLAFFESKRLLVIPKPKVKNANQTDLVVIGKRLKIAFSEIPEIPNITHILIENQISTIATRMKTIQGMVAQYFIMQLEDPRIEFISSSNKLKNFVSNTKEKEGEKDSHPLENTFYATQESMIESTYAENTDDEIEENTTKCSGAFDKKVYKQHKSDGIKYCLEILSKHHLSEWADKMIVHKKKDDLADCFLQGYWYLQKNLFFNSNSNSNSK